MDGLGNLYVSGSESAYAYEVTLSGGTYTSLDLQRRYPQGVAVAPACPSTYAVTSGPATVSGSTLSYTGPGTVSVTASQAGNVTYAAATPVTDTFTVTQAVALIDWAPSTLKIFTDAAPGAGVLDATDSIPATIAYTAGLLPSGTATTVTATSVLTQGSYSLTATVTPADTTRYATTSDSLPLTVQNMNLFTVNSTSGVGSLYNNGSQQSAATSGGGIGAAVDNAGFVWSANADGSGVSRFTEAGTRAANYTSSAAGLSTPASVAIDGAGSVWIANSGNGSVSQFSNAGVPLSPTHAAAGTTRATLTFEASKLPSSTPPAVMESGIVGSRNRFRT